MYQKINFTQVKSLLKLTCTLSIDALNIYKREFTVTEKENDQGPVTEADLHIDQIFTDHKTIKELNIPIISEERQPPENIDPHSYYWFIDPIDGTKEFIKKNGEWSIMIGLVKGTKPILGIVAQPATNTLYVGGEYIKNSYMITDYLDSDHWINELIEGINSTNQKISSQHINKIHCNSNLKWEDLTIVCSKSHVSKTVSSIIQQTGLSKLYRHGSIGLKQSHIAQGRADLYINPAGYCHLWDTCAGDAILRTAGSGTYADKQLLRYTPTTKPIKSVFYIAEEKTSEILYQKLKELEVIKE